MLHQRSSGKVNSNIERLNFFPRKRLDESRHVPIALAARNQRHSLRQNTHREGKSAASQVFLDEKCDKETALSQGACTRSYCALKLSLLEPFRTAAGARFA